MFLLSSAAQAGHKDENLCDRDGPTTLHYNYVNLWNIPLTILLYCRDQNSHHTAEGLLHLWNWKRAESWLYQAVSFRITLKLMVQNLPILSDECIIDMQT